MCLPWVRGWSVLVKERRWECSLGTPKVYYNLLQEITQFHITIHNRYLKMKNKEKTHSLFYLKLAQVKIAYVNFVNHCYVDTEVEMKEIYTSNHIWKLFENFLVDMARVSYTLIIKYYFMFSKVIDIYFD